MVCPSCGFKTEHDFSTCPNCGRAPAPRRRTVRCRLRLTPDEALSGARRRIRLPGREEPLRLKLPQGLQDGDVLELDGIRLQSGGAELTVKLLMTVEIALPRPAPVPAAPPAEQKCADKPKRERGYTAFAVRSVLVLLLCAALVCAFIVGCVGLKREDLPELSLPSASELLSRIVLSASPAAADGNVRELAAQEIWRFDRRGYLNQMDDRLLEDVLAIYRAAMNFESEAVLPNKLSERELISICNLMALDCTELIQTDLFSKRWEHDGAGKVTRLKLSYVMSQEEYKPARAECQALAEQLAYETEGMSDINRELYVYNYIIANCVYDRGGTHAFSPYGVFSGHSAKCDGFSKAMKWALDEMGIDCRCVSGAYIGRDDGHTWCTVRLGDNWYDVDVTADVSQSGQWQPVSRGAVNIASGWVRSQFEPDAGLDLVSVPEGADMSLSAHVLDGTFIYAGEDIASRFDALLSAYCSYGGSVCFQIESVEDYEYLKANMDWMLTGWFDRNLWGTWNYQTWYSDAYRTMTVSVSG